MSQACRQFREDWFDTAARGGASPDRRADQYGASHTGTCDACARWVTAVRRDEAMLGDLERRLAPAAMDERIGDMLADVASGISMQPRSIRTLRMLSRLPAPRELEAAVFAGAEELLREPWCVQGLRSVDPVAAPGVLDRLVGEELADPRAALARRFAGDLERPQVPKSLAARVRHEFTARYRPSLVRAALPFATAAAAALLIWVGLAGRGGDTGDAYSFRVTYADSPAELTGMARGLASALGGGVPGPPVASGRVDAPVRTDGEVR